MAATVSFPGAGEPSWSFGQQTITVLTSRVTHWEGYSQKKATVVYLDTGESVQLGCWPDEFKAAYLNAVEVHASSNSHK
ncbi:hypothetical protein [Shewanella xiamenensis]|uniref:hypothetical protein n=1 Tax=Shewanella xiamenensis TaxID=332186 RepID=UPI0008499011|nr:hypothetical protein [Shewanella xiamenensis]ODR86731.1 hypothetical protein ABT47_16180 [Shewanella xiamenensis]